MIDSNDDANPRTRDSEVMTFTPEVSGTYYLGVTYYDANPNRGDGGGYLVSVEELPEYNLIVGDMGENKQDKLMGTDDARPDHIFGETDHDSLYGGRGDDMLDGGPGNDLLLGGPGADELVGGEDPDGDDQDTISYKTSMAGVTINLLTGTARGGDADGDTFGTDIEDVQGSMYDDRLSGDNKAIHSGPWQVMTTCPVTVAMMTCMAAPVTMSWTEVAATTSCKADRARMP